MSLRIVISNFTKIRKVHFYKFCHRVLHQMLLVKHSPTNWFICLCSVYTCTVVLYTIISYRDNCSGCGCSCSDGRSTCWRVSDISKHTAAHMTNTYTHIDIWSPSLVHCDIMCSNSFLHLHIPEIFKDNRKQQQASAIFFDFACEIKEKYIEENEELK